MSEDNKTMINPTVRLLLKPRAFPQREIVITGLPTDLTRQEYEKIKKILDAFVREE